MRTPSPDVNQQLIAIGFAYCSSSASGQTSRMSAAIGASACMERSPRKMPPGPSVSPTAWSMP